MSEHVIVIDTETTGLDDEVDWIVQLCIRHGLEPDAPTELWCIKPMIGIPAEATATHGITDAMTADWPTFGEVADQVRPHIERADVIVGYNVDFDVGMLKSEFRRAGTPVKWPPLLLCALRMWNIYEPRPPRNLQAAYQRFVDPAGFEGAHGALPDTVACAKVLAAQMALWKGDKAWHEMDPERATWWGPSHQARWVDGDLTVGFGKYKGTRWGDVDPGFCKWILLKDFPPHIRAVAQQVIRRRATNLERTKLIQGLNRWAQDAALARGWT